MNHSDEIRSFIAIPLPDKIKDTLEEKINDLKRHIPNNSVKWVQVNNIHLTLKFLGNVQKPVHKDLIQKLEEEHPIQRFSLFLQKLGAFPSIYKPNVIWAGVSNNEYLVELSKRVDIISNSLINDLENKPFSPHLTIARIKPGMKKEHFELIKQTLFNNRDISNVEFPVDHYCLYKSTLTSQGAVYSLLHEFKLSG